MKKIILLSLILSIFGTSCVSRKVNVQKENVTEKLDSTSVVKKEVVTTQDNNVSIVTNTDEIEIVPIDTTKSITVDGKKYHNVKIRHKKTKVVLSDKTKTKVSENALIKATVKKKLTIEMAKKQIDKKAFISTWFWW